MGLAFVTFLVYMLAFRDTWEIDNYAVITGLYMEGANLIAVEEFTEGLAKHHEIIVFVGDRNLKNNHLKEIYRRVRDDYETTKLRWESIYRPLLPKYAEAQLLITSFKYDEAITFCNSIIDGYSPHKDDRFVAKRLNALNELKEQADKEWEKAIDDERSELLPKLLALKEEADKFIDADKWDMALTRLQSIVNAKPPRMWTDEVRTTLDYANAKIGAYRYSKIRRESARYQAITPSYRRTEEEVKRRATQVMPPGRMFARNMADSVVNNITSKSAAFRSAVFTGTTDKGRGEISYNYNVEYLTGGGFVRVGKFNVAIVNGQCREVYFNGGELWVQMIDPALQGYRDPK
jgi:tetratricopeptide (TPR) repeat protein